MPTLFEDNLTAIKWPSSEESYHLKHIINLWYHFVRQDVLNEHVKIVWVLTESQLADSLTKAIGLQAFLKLRNKILFLKHMNNENSGVISHHWS